MHHQSVSVLLFGANQTMLLFVGQLVYHQSVTVSRLYISPVVLWSLLLYTGSEQLNPELSRHDVAASQ